MIEIEAPQEVLVGFATAGVLYGDHPGHGLEQLSDPEHRSDEKIGTADGSFGCRSCRADQLGVPSEDDDLLHGGRRLGAGGAGETAGQQGQGGCQ